MKRSDAASNQPGEGLQDSAYDRYAGFMLGFALQLQGFEWARARYPAHRRRIQEMLGDLDVSVTLPSSHRHFGRAYAELHERIGDELLSRSVIVADFFTLGSFLLLELTRAYGRTRTGRRITGTFEMLLDQYGIDATLVRRYMKDRRLRASTGSAFITELISACYAVATAALLPCKREPDGCFVIMPFADRFQRYYSAFYRPAIERAGMRPLRAWAGVTNERYLLLLLLLIDRSRCVLADLTPSARGRHSNLNVIHEIGLAQASARDVFLVRQPGTYDIPSNLTGLPIISYDPGGTDWPQGQADACARVMRLVQRRSRSMFWMQ